MILGKGCERNTVEEEEEEVGRTQDRNPDTKYCIFAVSQNDVPCECFIVAVTHSDLKTHFIIIL